MNDQEQTELTPIVPGIAPKTRQGAIVALSVIALACISAEVAMAFVAVDTSDALMAVASTAVGGVAGLAVPHKD